MIVMKLQEGENIERALKKFKRKYERTGVLKELRRRLIITAKIPVCPYREIIGLIGFWAAVFAIVFCVVRGLPVIIEAKYLFEKK